MAEATLFHFHDPMCSWCWGYKRTWKQVRDKLPDDLQVIRILGGLAPDSDDPMPPALQQTIRSHWEKVREVTGADFNFDFWDKCTPKRSTYPACRAVLAAQRQGRYLDMLSAIQEAYYLRAMNPSEKETLLKLAEELDLDKERFSRDLDSAEVNEELMHQVEFARTLAQGFPSLVLRQGRKLTPIPVNYQNAEETLGLIMSLLREV